jgi:hypothetical protein
VSEQPLGDPAAAASPDLDVDIDVELADVELAHDEMTDVDDVVDDGGQDETLDAEPTRTEVTPTGDQQVDPALARLPELDRLPTAEHVAVYEDVHRSLQEALGAAGGGAGGSGGPRPAVPGPPRR